jgi:hypothetical protein
MASESFGRESIGYRIEEVDGIVAVVVCISQLNDDIPAFLIYVPHAFDLPVALFDVSLIDA